MTVNAYLNKFTQRSRYAPDEGSADEKKHDAFLNGLNDKIQFQLLNTDYEDFQKMVDKAIIVKNKFKEMRRMARGKHRSRDSLREATPGLACLSQGLSSETRVRSPVDAWTASSIPNATTELSVAAPELPDAEASATGSSTQCAATVSPERTARPSPNHSNLTECTSSGEP
jgi:hypothetical protein